MVKKGLSYSYLGKSISDEVFIFSSDLTYLYYVGITLHYISEEDKIEKVVLDLVYFPPPHTGCEISLLVTKIFQKWEIKVLIIVTDNGSNMVKAFEQARSNHVQDVINSVVANNTERNGVTEAVHEENLFSDSSDVETDIENLNDLSFNEETSREFPTPIPANSNALDFVGDATRLDISETTSEIEIENEEVEFLQFERQASEAIRTIFPRKEGESEEQYLKTIVFFTQTTISHGNFRQVQNQQR